MHNYLKKLLENKKKEVQALKKSSHFSSVAPRSSKKSFKASLLSGNAVIAEIKRKSPSKSHIGDIPDPVTLAQRYAEGGAAAISVLTDAYGFGGSMSDLKQVVKTLSTTSVPVLRKDFMIDPIQIAETVSVGADAILLIVAALKEKTAELLAAARALNIDALVEVLDQAELDYALSIEADLIAVNNRDLTTFDVDLNRALKLSASMPDAIVSVAASGMDSPALVSTYFSAGYNAVLVGEALVKSSDPAQFIKDCRI